jgi:hypothetical protein
MLTTYQYFIIILRDYKSKITIEVSRTEHTSIRLEYFEKVKSN